MARFHQIEIGSVVRHLPVVPLSDDIAIAFLKLYGDAELISAAAELIARRVTDDVELLVGPEAGGILLTHLVAARLTLPYVILRKKRRPNMLRPIVTAVRTIATEGEQNLFLDDADIEAISGRRVAIVDEVVSSGATIEAVRSLVRLAGGYPGSTYTVAVEGEARPNVEALIRLPIFMARPHEDAQ